MVLLYIEGGVYAPVCGLFNGIPSNPNVCSMQ
jgi:hypothetical protein